MNFIFKISALSLIIITYFSACNYNNKESIFEETFLIVTHKIVEKFENDKLIDKKTTTYFYDRKNDFFWKKAIVKDSSGNLSKTINRKLDNNLRLPIEETVLINGNILLKSRLKYSIDNYELLYKEDFKNGKKIHSLYRHYDDYGYLISQEDTLFENNRIKNISNIKYLKSIGKPKGFYPINGFYSFKKVIKNTNIDTFMITKYDKLNYPYFDSLYQSGNTQINWYKVIVDDDKIVALIAYNNKDLTSISSGKNQFKFEYNSDGLVEKIEDMKYDDQSGEFEILDNIQTFEWILPKFKSRYNFADYNFTRIGSCINKKEHVKYEKKIVRFDDVGKKVVEEYLKTFKGDCFENDDVESELIKRTTYIFNKLEIKGETAVIYKNKKVEKEFKEN